jgi:hypothetical protein
LKQERIQTKETLLMQKLSTVLAFYLAISTILPQLKAIPGYQLTVFFTVLLWIFSTIIVKPSFFMNLNIHSFLIFVFIFYTVITPYLFGNGTIGNRYLDYGVTLIFYLIYLYNEKFGFINSSKAIIRWSLPFLVYTCVVTLTRLFSNPYLARSIKSDGAYTNMLRIQGIGGYELIYFLVFICIILFFQIINRKELGLKNNLILLFLIVLLILFCMTVIYSNYLTALLMLLVSFTVILYDKTKNLLFRIYIVSTSVILLIFSKSLFELITDWLIIFLGEGATVNKLITLQSDIGGNTGGGSILLERTTRLEQSWDAFAQSPIFGIITDSIYSNGGFLVGFGQHSQIVDTFALFGLVIGLINIYIILHPFLLRMKRKNVLSGLNVAILISVIILYSMNNVTNSIGFAIFFIYPVLYNWLYDKMRKDTDFR